MKKIVVCFSASGSGILIRQMWHVQFGADEVMFDLSDGHEQSTIQHEWLRGRRIVENNVLANGLAGCSSEDSCHHKPNVCE